VKKGSGSKGGKGVKREGELKVKKGRK